MSGHRVLHDMFQAPYRTTDVGDAKTFYCDRFGMVAPVTTGASGETRTLARPSKAGLICTVMLDTDGGGDLTLTVTGGYNQDADTSITLGDAGDFVTFIGVRTGTTYAWRVLAQEGTDVKTPPTTTGDAVTAEHAAGAVGTGLAPKTYRYTRDGTIITEIHVDLTGLKCKGDAQGDAIGLTGAAYIGRYVTATNGIVYRIEMICLETPGEGTATITDDIDLMAEDDDDVAYDGPVDDTVLARGGAWVAGQMIIDNVPALTANDYLYLGEGDTAATTGVYDAGQFIIKLYGHPVLS